MPFQNPKTVAATRTRIINASYVCMLLMGRGENREWTAVNRPASQLRGDQARRTTITTCQHSKKSSQPNDSIGGSVALRAEFCHSYRADSVSVGKPWGFAEGLNTHPKNLQCVVVRTSKEHGRISHPCWHKYGAWRRLRRRTYCAWRARQLRGRLRRVVRRRWHAARSR